MPEESRPPSGAPQADWAVEAADKVEQFVSSIRSKTSDRLVGVARLVVFGVLAAIMGVMALILLTIASVRALDELIPRGVWIPYVLVGAIFVAAGSFLWSKKKARPAPA